MKCSRRDGMRRRGRLGNPSNVTRGRFGPHSRAYPTLIENTILKFVFSLPLTPSSSLKDENQVFPLKQTSLSGIKSRTFQPNRLLVCSSMTPLFFRSVSLSVLVLFLRYLASYFRSLRRSDERSISRQELE